MRPLKALLNRLPASQVQTQPDDATGTAAVLPPSSDGLFVRGMQPLLFCGLREPMRLQFGLLAPGQTRLVMRVQAPAPVTLTGTVDYRAAMGSSLGTAAVTLTPSDAPLPPLPEETGLEHLWTGGSYRLATDLTPPEGTRAVVMQLDPPAQGAEDLLLMMQSIRIQCPVRAPGNPSPAHAIDAYAFVRDGGPSLQVIAKLRAAPEADMARVVVTLSDLIGTGPAVARMRRFDADAALLPLSKSEARDRSGRAVLAVPRVRKLEAPGRSTKTFDLEGTVPQTLDMDITMIQSGTNGYVNVLGTAIGYLRVQNPEYERMALEDIAAGYYRDAMAESDEALVRLRF